MNEKFFSRGIKFLGVAGILVLMVGCARYSSQPITHLTTLGSSNRQDQVVSFAYNKFSLDDCKRYLDRNVLSKGYQPVLLTLSNDTNRYLTFSKSNLSLPSVSALEVAQKVHTSTIARVAAYGIPGVLFLWPLVIPAVVDGIGSSKANEKLDMDFLRKELSDQVLAPYSKASGIVFVPREKFNNDFKLKFVDLEHNDQFVLSTSNPMLKVKNI